MPRLHRPTLPTNRPLAALVAADGVSRFGDGIYLVALPVLVWDRTHSELLVGLTVAGRLLPFLVLSMPAGAVADRFSRTGILVVAETTRAVAMVLAAVLCAMTTDVAGVIVAAAVAAAAGTFAMPAFMSLVPQAARSDAELGRANAAMATIDGLAGIVGPALAGILLVVGGLPAAFLLNGVTFAVLVVTVLALGPSLRARTTVAGDAPATVDGATADAPTQPTPSISWSTLARDLAPQLCLDGAVSLVSAALGVLTVLVAVDIASAGSAFTGPLNAASGGGALVGALVAARFVGRRAGRGATLAVAVLLAAMVLLAVPGQPAAALVAMGGAVAALILLDTLNITAVQVAAGDAATGRAIGLLHTLAAAWMLVGTLIATVAAATAGAAPPSSPSPWRPGSWGAPACCWRT